MADSAFSRNLIVPGLMAICALGAATGMAQQPAAPKVVGAGHPVVIPVTAHDKKGALAEIQKADLTVTEDGRPQVIQSLTRAGEQPLRLGLLFDTSKAMSGALEAERKAGGSFVDQVLPAGGKNQAFLLHFDREVELLEDFTSSGDRLHRELDSMSATRRERDELAGPERTGDEENTVRHGHNGTQLYDAIFLASDELMKGKDGRKVLVLVSNGADRGSKDTLNAAMDAADRANVVIYTIFLKGTEERENGGFGNGGDRRRTGGSWPGGGGGYPGGGGGYPGGGGGRREPEPRAANGADGKKVMQQIAARTGGHAFEAKRPDDIGPIYSLIQQDLKAQYLLTYTPDKADEGGFHKVVVTANNKDMSVSAPEGYFGKE